MFLEHNYDELEEIVVVNPPFVDNLMTHSEMSQANVISNQSFQMESEQNQTKL